MSATTTPIGRTIRSSAMTFTFGGAQEEDGIPPFGSLVRGESGQTMVYGIVYDVIVEDDPFVRQIVAASDELTAERIEDMRQRRQVPVEVTALAIAYRSDGVIYQRIPPRPPGALRPIYVCDNAEVVETLKQFNYFRTVLNSAHCPAEELLAASLRHAARCQPPGQEQRYLLDAGRELARLLAVDPPRLEAILRRLTL